MEDWNTGMMEGWSIGRLEYWKIGWIEGGLEISVFLETIVVI